MPSAGSHRPVRRFTLLDLLTLVGAAAVGLALLRLPGMGFLPGMRYAVPTGSGLRYNRIAIRSVTATVPLLIAFTVATLAMRLRGPRPRLRWLGRQPGYVACTAALLGLLYESLWMLANAIRFGLDAANRGFLPTAEGFFLVCGGPAALWVVAAWVSLALCGRCRPERSWIDRLGWGIGVAWIVGGLVMRASVLLIGL